MKELIVEAANLIRNSKYGVAFTGAGISVESGIPPFRGAQGLWSRYDPKVLDIDYFHANTLSAWKVIYELFYEFFGKAEPNPAHKILGYWEKKGYLKSVITQNIDNLHQEAGSKNVYEFHGTASTLACTNCGTKYPSDFVDNQKLPPKCGKCQGVLKPDFVFFGEGIPADAHEKSFNDAQKADVFIVIGTTGEVMPASMLPYTAKQNGAVIIEINPESSNFTNQITDIYLNGKASEVLTDIEMQILNL